MMSEGRSDSGNTHNQLVLARIRSIRAADRACIAWVMWAYVSAVVERLEMPKAPGHDGEILAVLEHQRGVGVP